MHYKHKNDPSQICKMILNKSSVSEQRKTIQVWKHLEILNTIRPTLAAKNGSCSSFP